MAGLGGLKPEVAIWDRERRKLAEKFRQLIDRAPVAANGAATSEVTRVGSDDSEDMGRLRGFLPTVGKDSYILGDTILGDVDDGSATPLGFTAPLTVPAASTGPWSTLMPIGASVSKHFSQAAADTGTNPSNSAEVTAADFTVTTPNATGTTWSVSALGGLLLEHDAGGTTVVLLRINGVDKAGRAVTRCVATGGARAEANGTEGAIGPNATVHVLVRYRSSTAGTTTARNPSATVTVERTG